MLQPVGNKKVSQYLYENRRNPKLWQNSSYNSLTHPDHTEVQFGLLGTLQYQLEARLALIGHPIVIVTFQDPLLFSCKHGPQVHLRHNQDDGINFSPLKTLDAYKHTCYF